MGRAWLERLRWVSSAQVAPVSHFPLGPATAAVHKRASRQAGPLEAWAQNGRTVISA